MARRLPGADPRAVRAAVPPGAPLTWDWWLTVTFIRLNGPGWLGGETAEAHEGGGASAGGRRARAGRTGPGDLTPVRISIYNEGCLRRIYENNVLLWQ